MSAVIPRLTRFADGVTAVDTEYVRPQMDASHVVVADGQAAIIDTGPNTAVPLILAALDELQVSADAVRYLFLTHVHLDHAGGAGALMRALPNASCVVHPRGAPHMIDPSKLIDGTRAVYGPELYGKLYGEILPIDRERIVIAQDGQRFALPGRDFECVHTPGHALHHQAIVDHSINCIFTGDTFGISYREFDTARGPWIMPTTTPTQFDPAQLKASIIRLMQFRPRSSTSLTTVKWAIARAWPTTCTTPSDQFVRIARAGRTARPVAHALRRCARWAHEVPARARLQDDAGRHRRHPRPRISSSTRPGSPPGCSAKRPVI